MNAETLVPAAVRVASILAIATVALLGCKRVNIELSAPEANQPLVEQQPVCDESQCVPSPDCNSRDPSCTACQCCGCPDGLAFCDPTDMVSAWVCVDGCFVHEQTCTSGALCVDMDWGVSCMSFDGCDPETTLGPCSVQNVQWCWDDDVSAYVVSCGGSGCWEPEPCSEGATCVEGWKTGLATCSDDLDCDSIGCTGLPICGQDTRTTCGPCGCCDPQLYAFCAPDSDANGTPSPPEYSNNNRRKEAAWNWNSAGRCYDISRCQHDERCYERTEAAWCL